MQLKVVSGQALALNSLGINKFLSGDLKLASEMFQARCSRRSHLQLPATPNPPPLHPSATLKSPTCPANSLRTATWGWWRQRQATTPLLQ